MFVTTSDFPKGAKDHLARVQRRIVLANGDPLARLMIAPEVGARKTCVLVSVDADHFGGVQDAVAGGSHRNRSFFGRRYAPDSTRTGFIGMLRRAKPVGSRPPPAVRRGRPARPRLFRPAL